MSAPSEKDKQRARRFAVDECIPDVDGFIDFWTEELAAARAEERAAIVAWVRKQRCGTYALVLALEIEQGEHAKDAWK